MITFAGVSRVAEADTRIRLSAPRQQGRVAVEQTISRRRSVRGFGKGPLSENQLSQLLWAAQGITSCNAKRAAPSAGALYPLEVSVLCANVGALNSGIYRYHPASHDLQLVAAGCLLERLVAAARHQEWIATAPAVIGISAVFERTTVKYGNSGVGYAYMEAGAAAESLMLQAVAMGLGTTMVGAFDDDEVKRLLQLAPHETPLCLVPVGGP
jgi:SagB-type dehydrogenase family enzyme